VCDRPFFPGPARWQGSGLIEFPKTTSDRFPVTVEEPGDVSNTAVSEFAGFDCGVKTTFAFAETMENLLHRTFNIDRVGGTHGGVLPELPRFRFRARNLPRNSRAQNPKWGS
jgi:hypothetical protein